jgi:hypothetical protein
MLTSSLCHSLSFVPRPILVAPLKLEVEGHRRFGYVGHESEWIANNKQFRNEFIVSASTPGIKISQIPDSNAFIGW